MQLWEEAKQSFSRWKYTYPKVINCFNTIMKTCFQVPVYWFIRARGRKVHGVKKWENYIGMIFIPLDYNKCFYWWTHMKSCWIKWPVLFMFALSKLSLPGVFDLLAEICVLYFEQSVYSQLAEWQIIFKGKCPM